MKGKKKKSQALKGKKHPHKLQSNHSEYTEKGIHQQLSLKAGNQQSPVIILDMVIT